MAWARVLPHMSAWGVSDVHTAGRSARPKRRQRSWASSCTQGTPAGFPCGMPGIGEVIDGAVQHAPHWGRQSMVGMLSPPSADAIVGGPGSAHNANRNSSCWAACCIPRNSTSSWSAVAMPAPKPRWPRRAWAAHAAADAQHRNPGADELQPVDRRHRQGPPGEGGRRAGRRHGRGHRRAGIQFRILNGSKGPAVRATRAQADRVLYKAAIRRRLENQPNCGCSSRRWTTCCSRATAWSAP
jgi:hypothetical protein